ncbi:MAG: hypothetical protein HY293_03815 [Planctomycetes bacterium]|nr:hypothetical protein [Planctomycetota bacterium]
MNRAVCRVLLYAAVAAAFPLAACSAGPRSTSPSGSSSMEGDAAADTIYLTNREVVKGKILSETSTDVTVEKENTVAVINRGAIYNIEYSKESYTRKSAPPLQPSEPLGQRRPASTWFPRSSASQPVNQTEITWSNDHEIKSCIGPALSDAFQRFPEIRLFVTPGGKVTFHDSRKWGYHAHVASKGMLKPEGRPGLTIPLPQAEGEIPDSVTFVSPSQEIKTADGTERSSYAIPDAIHAVLKPVSQAQATLSVQPFAGGKPVKTKNGELWAFGLPRNSSTWYLYLHDDAGGSHSKLIGGSFAAFGDTVLAPDNVIDVQSADGAVSGRVMVLPFPEDASADGAAAVTVCTGPREDPSVLVTLPLPPRQVVVSPHNPPALKADVWVQHYDVSNSVPQSLVVAHGTGRPTADVSISARELTPDSPDERIKLDFTSRKEEQFPLVVWIYARRTYAWKTAGGYLPPVAPLTVPSAPELQKLVRVKYSLPLSHVLPLYFQGPKPASTESGHRGMDPAVGMIAGMSTALVQDAFARQGGGMTQNISPSATGGSSSPGSGAFNNTTNVTVVVPPQTGGIGGVPGFGSLGSGGLGGMSPVHPYAPSVPPAGTYLSSYPGFPGGVSPASALIRNAGAPMQVSGYTDPNTGRYYNTSGQAVYDPAWNSGPVNFTRRSGP